ncbi:unnamed protein product [Ilex paraguariensis]|uniref:Uncharacterized protein n=1 Tax=Ilex paraguariensis TaxID=185542 RepID=A0ABC8S0N2_9AQUA
MPEKSNAWTLAGAIGPTDWNEALDVIVDGSPEQSVEGTKVVCHDLAQATSDPKSSAMFDAVCALLMSSR